ncbi:MAG TPA: hypothetical protein VFX70_09865 [Mycobacteriales bacterium]|nr:hypothetical protein [Mycobacteriales bacterium]
MAGPVVGMVVGMVGGLAIQVVTAPAARAATCGSARGVTVVVDFASLGGGVRTGCAAGDPSSGLDALTRAGFGYVFARRQPGFVCRIDGAPNSDRDPCEVTSPADASWSYWHAQPGGSWSYSTAGAGSFDPAPGRVEGWAFGDHAQPPAPAPAPPATKAPTPRPTGHPSVSPTSAPVPATVPAPRPGGPGRPGTAAGPGRTGAGTRTADPTRSVPPASVPSGSGSPVRPSGASDPPRDRTGQRPAAAVSDRTGGGGLAGVLGGVVIIAALGGLAAFVARRRARPGA